MGFIAAAESDRSLGEVINLGSNFEISVGETARLIADLMGVGMEIETETARLRPENSEVERLWADNHKAKSLLGWTPVYGGREGFRKGLAETISWFAEESNIKDYKVDLYNI